jgi:prevent-host-death family protein
MEEIAISKFKATCLAVLERVRQTGQPVRITRFGKPVAEIVAPSPPKNTGDWLGCMAGTAEIVGDIVDTSDLWDPEETVREWDELEPIGAAIEARNVAEQAARSRKRGKA